MWLNWRKLKVRRTSWSALLWQIRHGISSNSHQFTCLHLALFPEESENEAKINLADTTFYGSMDDVICVIRVPGFPFFHVRWGAWEVKLAHIYPCHADWLGVTDLCQQHLSQYASLLGPLNIVMVKLHQEMLEARLELQQWTKALETAEQLLKPYRWVNNFEHCVHFCVFQLLIICHYRHHLCKYHPTLTVHLLKVAKLRRLIATTEQLELSIRDLSQVSANCRVMMSLWHNVCIGIGFKYG